jgi:hypothetical protein
MESLNMGSPAVEIISHASRCSMTTFQKIVIKQLTCDLTLRLQELVEVQKFRKAKYTHDF